VPARRATSALRRRELGGQVRRGVCSSLAAAVRAGAVVGATWCQGPCLFRGRCMPGLGARGCQRTKTLKTQFSLLAVSLSHWASDGGELRASPVRRQSACAKLTLKTTRNVRVRAPKTSECVRRSARNVKVRAPIHAGCVRVARRRRRPREGEVSVKEDASPWREGMLCGLAQEL